MAYNTTVAEAATMLGISSSRIYQLLERGALDAERVGRTWLIDSASVHERLEQPVAAGRPKTRRPTCETIFSLMNRTHEVLEFRYDEESGLFGEVVTVIDAKRAPLGIVSARGAKASSKALRYWWTHRAIPDTRSGLEARLRELGLNNPESLPFKSLGLSLSDQYWVRPKETKLHWEDINYFHSEFDLAPGPWLANVGLRSPDNTSEGELPKRWTIEGGRRILLKGAGPLGQEPYNEVAASALFRRLLPAESFVPYEVRVTDAGPISACQCFLHDDEEYIPAFYVRQIMRQPNHHSDHHHMIECLAKLGVPDAELHLAYMIVCDDILGNFDRHYRNFGVIRNVETLECRMAPLFDSGSCLWCNTPTDSLLKGSWKFSTKPFHEDANRQLRLVNDYAWFNPNALEGFAAEVIEILGANPAIADRLDAIASAVDWRIGRILATL